MRAQMYLFRQCGRTETADLLEFSRAHSDRTSIAMSAAERPSAGMLRLENRYIKVLGSKLDWSEIENKIGMVSHSHRFPFPFALREGGNRNAGQFIVTTLLSSAQHLLPLGRAVRIAEWLIGLLC